MSDELILVDYKDREIGSCDKETAHRSKKLHRAFSVFLYDGNKMLIQRRHRDKYHSGGLWANACCSHPRKGEELEDAVHRRMSEEIGLDCEVEELFSFTYFTKYSDAMYEYEYDHVFLGAYAGEVHCDPEEIEACRWVELEVLKRELLEDAERFSTWFLIAAPRVIEEIEKRIG